MIFFTFSLGFFEVYYVGEFESELEEAMKIMIYATGYCNIILPFVILCILLDIYWKWTNISEHFRFHNLLNLCVYIFTFGSIWYFSYIFVTYFSNSIIEIPELQLCIRLEVIKFLINAIITFMQILSLYVYCLPFDNVSTVQPTTVQPDIASKTELISISENSQSESISIYVQD